MTAKQDAQKIQDNAGHRQRVYKRFWKNNGEDMEDYELLEFILMQAIPRRDVKPIAKELLRKFGSFAKVMYAPVDELQQVSWVKDSACAHLKAIVASVKRICREQLRDQSSVFLKDIDALVEYARAVSAYEKNEELRIIYLDAALKVISDELMQKGTLTGVVASPRAIVTKAMENNAAGIILVHNHPSDNIKPSAQDDALTADVCEACRLMGVTLHDHIIIGRSRYYSYREKGVL